MYATSIMWTHERTWYGHFVVGLLSLLLTLVNSACPSKSVQLTAERGPQFITSPNFPNGYGVYDKRLSCSWLITASTEYEDVIIQMQITHSDMEYSTGCVRDSVNIHDGPKDFFRPLKSWCGQSFPYKVFSSTGRTVLVVFSTDFNNNHYKGFRLAYWLAKQPVLIVNVQEWTTVNYALLGISIGLLGGGPGWLLALFIKREVIPKLKLRKQQ